MAVGCRPVISSAGPDDADRAATLIQLVREDRVVTAAGVRYTLKTARAEDRMAFWRAEVGGELVGWAFGGLDAFAPVRTAGFASVIVHPQHRRRGIGSELWAPLSAHLEAIGARRIVSHSDGDDDTRAFAAARGYRLEGTHSTLALDPRSLPPPPEPPAGVELVPMSRFADDPEPVYVADSLSAQDEPGPSDFSGMTFEIWRRHIWGHPDQDRELSLAALVGGSVVGTTFLYSDRASGRAANAGTGVIREHRGRGLGLLMKQHSLARAAAAGITRVTTQNDETNAPMLAINARLGYEPFAVGHAWVLER
jgi:GNAT superfamily N-acetyltransferase